jgi:predicted RNA-binding Zn ribbon-like protein
VVTDPDLIVDFVNSLELRPHIEQLGTPAALDAWFAEHGVAEAGFTSTEDDLREAVELREAIRTLLAAQNEVPGDVDAAAAVLDRVARHSDLAVRFTAAGLHIEPCSEACSGGLGRILAEVASAMADGTWAKLKACRADDCLWAFLDTAKNQSRAWCSMRSCGNRQKVRTYRARHGVA